MPPEARGVRPARRRSVPGPRAPISSSDLLAGARGSFVFLVLEGPGTPWSCRRTGPPSPFFSFAVGHGPSRRADGGDHALRSLQRAYTLWDHRRRTATAPAAVARAAR